MIRFRFEQFTTSDGTSVSLPPSGVVVFVGPNNAGKSQALKDLIAQVRSGANYVPKVVISVITSKQGTNADALEWVSSNLPQVSREGIPRVMVPGWGEVGPDDFARQWSGVGPYQLGPITDSLLLYADGTTRLTAGNAQPSFDMRSAVPAGPIQRAYSEPNLEAEFSAVSESAFGMKLVVDRYAGAIIPLRVGERPEFTHEQGLPTRRYLELLAKVPALEEQGDGVKSFVGLMIQLIAGNHEAILVDEPEAFLHPPQARLLGRLLAQRATDQQVFLATHSTAIVQGVSWRPGRRLRSFALPVKATSIGPRY